MSAPSLMLIETDAGHRAVLDYCPTAWQAERIVDLGETGHDAFAWDEESRSFLVDPDVGDPADAAEGGETAAVIVFREALRLGVIPTALGVEPDAGLARRAGRALRIGGVQ